MNDFRRFRSNMLLKHSKAGKLNQGLPGVSVPPNTFRFVWFPLLVLSSFSFSSQCPSCQQFILLSLRLLDKVQIARWP
jgi:hypothetical protein